MCTVTLVPLLTRPPHPSGGASEGGPRGTRLACNRDELRSRPIALPPIIRTIENRRAIMPIDPVSGGTWIAASDAGLMMTLLNVNPRRGSGGAPHDGSLVRSRGAIIPELIPCATLDEASDRAMGLAPRAFPPFCLVMADAGRVVEIRSDGRNMCRSDDTKLVRPVLYTSSGLGDHLVEGPRRKLFDELFPASAPPEDWLATQQAFHRHSWPDRTHLSVCMSRDEAWTVSMTIVELHEAGIEMSYIAGRPDAGTPAARIRLDDHDTRSLRGPGSWRKDSSA